MSESIAVEMTLASLSDDRLSFSFPYCSFRDWAIPCSFIGFCSRVSNISSVASFAFLRVSSISYSASWLQTEAESLSWLHVDEDSFSVSVWVAVPRY